MVNSSFQAQQFDVLVYGANAAGVGAAVTAARNNQFRVKVVEPLKMIGGMAAAGGVALMNQGGCGLSGLSKNWSTIVGKYYGLDDGMPYPPFPRMKESELAFWELLRSSSSIDVSTGCHAISVKSNLDGYLEEIQFRCDDEDDLLVVNASYVIDASYDGDIMTLAGVNHTSGRESRSKYNESLAGVQTKEWSDLESFALQNISMSPFDEETGELLKYIDSEPMPNDGDADDKLMAFQYFVCVSATPGNQIPFYPPENYNPKDFELLLRQTLAVIENGKFPDGPPLSYFGDVQCYDPVVEVTTGNRDCLLCCGTGPIDSDTPTLNKGWATSNYEGRLKMAKDYRYYTQGSLYFMSYDPRMPKATRDDVSRYGYCKDEYAEYGNFPPQLYVRISNRLIGQSILTQNNIADPRIKSDGVAMGCWPFDQHTVARYVVRDPENPNQKATLRNEGFFRAMIGSQGLSCDDANAKCDVEEFTMYNIPFGVMVPADPRQASNLLVPVAISASSVAYSSARIENMFMDLGSAAGVAVAELLSNGNSNTRLRVPVQETNITAVQEILTTVYKQNIFGPTQKRQKDLNLNAFWTAEATAEYTV